MSDVETIYNALLRTERRIEAAYAEATARASPACTHLAGASIAIHVLREEIGNDLAEPYARPRGDSE